MEWNWSMYLFGYLGTILHVMAKFTPDLKVKPSAYKVRVALWGALTGAITYTILFAAGMEGVLEKLNSPLTFSWGYFLAAIVGFAGSSAFQFIMHLIPWTGNAPDVFDGVTQKPKK